VRGIFDDATKLAEMPGMGHRREDLTERPVLFWSVHSYLLIYQPETSPLEFVHAVRGWRDVETLPPGPAPDKSRVFSRDCGRSRAPCRKRTTSMSSPLIL